MGSAKSRHPVLEIFYRRYLVNASPAAFIQSVSRRYTTATLERLAEHGRRESRRAATLALGFTADFRSNGVVGRRLRDVDRGVRVLADTAIRQLWCRDGSASQQQRLQTIARLNASERYSSALDQADVLIEEAPWFAEVRFQRAVSWACLGRDAESIRDCRQTLELNPYHFAAAVEMGQCYLRLAEIHAALDCFRNALALNPTLERVRAEAARLERKLRKKS